MDKNGDGIMVFLNYIALLLSITVLVSLVRVLAGPTVPDRLIGLDAANTLVVALFVIFALIHKELIYIDIAIIYATLAFVFTLYIAKYLEGKK